jgi:hypothetical protein
MRTKIIMKPIILTVQRRDSIDLQLASNCAEPMMQDPISYLTMILILIAAKLGSDM